MANTEPASGVVLFLEWLKNIKLTGGVAVDIGSGKGRNSIFLAQNGYAVTGLEYIEFARQCSEELSRLNNVSDKTIFLDACIDEVWPLADESFDIAIDSFSSIDIETKLGRIQCRNEIYRTLKPGGYALVTVCSAEDEWERELIAKHPGPEPNSTIWPQNEKFQKDYSEKELKSFYDMIEVCDFKVIRKPAHKLGRDGTATNLWLVIRKHP